MLFVIGTCIFKSNLAANPMSISILWAALVVRLVVQWYRIHLQSMSSGFNSWVRKIPQRRAWQPTPVLLYGESHGQWSLVGWASVHRVTKSQTQQSDLTTTKVLLLRKPQLPIELTNSAFFFSKPPGLVLFNK